ncbi:MAG: TIGR04255 family protein [Candidatus Heimdallarchaeota archaeon]
MRTAEDGLIHYGNPPVIEVVCGILFKPIRLLLAPHLGLLWEKFRSEYPKCREVPPLAPIIEEFEDRGGVPELRVQLTEKPPLPRIWFIHRNENGIIQVQRDRFLHNWRRVRPDDEYPRYYRVIEMFRKHLSSFESFLEENGLGRITPLQYEMTYVNHIPKGEGWETINEIGTVFPDFAFRRQPERFLPLPEAINWRTSFVLPERVGRLHVTIRRTVEKESSHPILLLELTVRGIGSEKSFDEMWSWFDLAHEWIVYGFADLTGKEVQRTVWKRKD